ncbi:MAG: NADH-quinone oxidoreductase subunit L, partial [Mesobacillus sp.]
NYGLFWLAVIAAFFTAFYMFRLFFMVFAGEARSEMKNVHESPSVMTLPMVVLGVLAVIAGYVNTPWFGTFLGDWLTEGNENLGHGHIEGPAWIMVVATVVSLLGILLAWMMYSKKSLSRDWLSSRIPLMYSVVKNKYFIDEIYSQTIVFGTKGISLFLRFIELFLVEGLVKLTTASVQALGKTGAKLQSGQVQTYGAIAFVGLAVLMVIFALTGGYL